MLRDCAVATELVLGHRYAGAELGLHGDDPTKKSFRDTHLRLQGPSVAHMTEVFLDSLEEAVLLDKLRAPVNLPHVCMRCLHTCSQPVLQELRLWAEEAKKR